MKLDALQNADKYTKAHRQKRWWYRVVTCLAAVVVFCTTYALILPAITLEGATCGLQEHTHSLECYTQVTSVTVTEPVCTLESLDLHRHTQSCYDENGEPVCGYADFVVHTHDASCYIGGKLWCPLPEIKVHIHDDSCYWVPEATEVEAHTHTEDCYALERGALICTESTEPQHTHTDACYSELTTQVCELSESPGHTHGESCYDEDGGLICGQEESEGHTHGESCYQTSTELICGLSEAPAHQHTDECYVWDEVLTCTLSTDPVETEEPAEPERICGKAEIKLHKHTFECFDESGNLICGRQQVLEHVHSDACFQTVDESVDTDSLTCTLEEGEGVHTHADGCYDENGDLVCELEESAGHRHTALCYGTWELNCTLQEHTHTEDCLPEEAPETIYFCGKEAHIHDESCYDEAGALTCGLEEHTHTEECTTAQETLAAETEATEPSEWDAPSGLPVMGTAYATVGRVRSYSVMLLDGDTEATTPLDVGTYVNGATLSYRTGDDSDWQAVTGETTIPGNSSLKLEIKYANVPIDDLLAAGGQMTYKPLPGLLRNASANGTIESSDGQTVGMITASGDTVTITFDTAWLAAQKTDTNTVINGDFYVEGQVNLSEVGDDGNATITVGAVTITAKFEQDILAKNADVDVTKAVSNEIITTEEGAFLEYTLTVTAGIDGCPGVTVVDAFTANDTFVSYAGLNTTATVLSDAGSPSETVAEGKNHGSVYQGGAPTEETPIPVEGSFTEDPGSLVWVIGDMEANETRSLTYRVKLKDNYTYIQNSSSKVISNEAQVYAQQYPRDKATANFEPKAGLDMRKTASDALRQEDGSYIITYTVWFEAYSTNNFVLENVRIEDRLNHPNNATAAASLEYISYVDGSFALYDNKTATGDPLTFETSAEIPSNPAMNEDEKGFVAYVGDMAPGTVRCIQYQVRVGLEAIGEAGGETLNVKNRALAYSDNAKNGGNNWLQAYSNTKTIQYDHWAKKLAGNPLTEDSVVPISGTVYDATGDTPVVESSPPVSFTAPVGSYQYTVTVNDLGDWDVTSASMKDTLGDQHMQFVGYVKVEGYDPDDNNTVKETIWVKVDGTRTFNFTLGQLGLTENTYAYRLTYYARPVQMEGVSQVVVANTFQLSGDIIIGEGYKFVLTGIKASAEVTVQGDNSFEAEKLAWYYEGAKTSSGNWSKGALYWAIKVDGNAFVAGTYLQDYIKYNSFMVFHSDSLVGVYTGSFPSGTQLTAYPDVESALNSGYLMSVDPSIYTMTLTNDLERGEGSFSELTIRMEQTVMLGDNTSLYIIVKLEPAFLPPNTFFGDSNGSLTYPNFLKSSDNGTDWENRGGATKTLSEGSNIRKQLGSTFSYDGTTITIKISGHVGTIPQNLLPEPGYYVAWEVKVNRGGDLSGKYRVVDTIPQGMELAYVRIKWRGTGTRNNPGAAVVQITDLGAGWTEHTVSAGLDGEAAMPTYFYTNGNQVCWDVDNLVAGKVFDNCSVDFQVVCRVTDPEVLLGGQEKTFNNQVSLINSRGEQHDADTNGVTISTSTMTKSAVWSGSSIPFTITVNPLGEDLLEGTATLTVVDTLSDTLKLDPTTITVINTQTQEAVDFTASLDGQILKIVVPDSQPLTITYSAKVQAPPNTEVSIKNDAHWEGYATTGGSSTENASYKYSVGGTVGSSATPFVEIVKYDQNNLTSRLAGAAFEMVEGTMENGVFTPSADTDRVWTGATDETGKLKFGDSPLLMAYNTVYRITETAAPSGYILDSTPYYFLVAKANEDGTYPEYPSGVHVHYDSSTYTCEIANRKGEATVKKEFKDPEKQSLDKVDGTYRFGIYDSEEASGTPLQTVLIQYGNGTVTPAGGIAKFTGLALGGTYYIYELDDSGQPIKEGNTAMAGGKLFEVSYNDGPSVTVPEDGTAAATVTVTNQVHYTALPETGGPGTQLYAMGGLLLMAAAGFLLLYNHTKRRKEDLPSS
ncbi:MAG: SpaA isopeptide-forming pilin-related protein [Candidatus Limivicinus sp.]